jgi:hypothetical protein
VSRTGEIFDRLMERGVSHGVGLPDSVTAPLIARFEKGAQTRWVPVTREGEAFAIAAGLWVGGRTPVVVIQNTGLLESGDSLRGVALRMGVPLLCLVTYRGVAGARASGWRPGDTLARTHLVRPDVDSTALLTEPTLDAWSVPHATYRSLDDLDRMWQVAVDESRPTVVLLPKIKEAV